jgi:hypothetical protein
MPLIHLICNKCKDTTRRIVRKTNLSNWGNCVKCAGLLERAPTGSSSQVVETVDNGVLRKAITRPAEIERLVQERAKSDPSKKTTEYV